MDHVYADRTLNNKNAHRIFVGVWVNACVEQGLDSLCVEASIHISERKLGQSVSKYPAIDSIIRVLLL